MSINLKWDKIIELRVLRYFLTVAKEENITKAAKLLKILFTELNKDF